MCHGLKQACFGFAAIVLLPSAVRAEANLDFEVSGYAEASDTSSLEETLAKPFVDFAEFTNQGYSSKVHVFKVTFRNPHAQEVSDRFQIHNSTLSELEIMESAGLKPIEHTQRFLPHFSISLPGESEREIFIRAKFGNSATFALSHASGSISNTTVYIMSACYGGMLAILIYNLLIFLRIRSLAHLFYCCYGLTVILALSNLTGYSGFFLEDGWFNDTTTILGPLTMFFGNRFCVTFLEAKTHLPRVSSFLRVHGYLALGIAASYLLFGLKEVTYLTDVLLATGPPMIVYASLRRWKQGFPPARFFTISWSVVMVTATFWVGSMLGLIPIILGAFVLSAGIAIEMLLLALALSESVVHLEKQLIAKTENLNADLQRQVEQERKIIEQQQEKLIFSEKMASLGLMAKNIAHEINNPLAIIKGNADLLKRKLAKGQQDPEKFAGKVTTISSECSRIKDIVQSLHNYARYDTDAELDQVSLREACDQVATLTKARVSHSQVKIRYEVDDTFVWGRLGQLVQVLSNLVVNAIDATEATGGEVRIYNELQDDCVRLHVHDTGPGVPQEIANQIFQPFVTTKGPEKGTGIGLNIAKGLMESQRGKLSLTPTEKGACFTLELALAEKAQAAIAS